MEHTVDLLTFDNDLRPRELARKTVEFEPKMKFIKVLVENPDVLRRVSVIKITATPGG